MVELEQWSQDLKANAEKKLAVSFETASKFRTMFLDKEAREKKVTEELRVAKAELTGQKEAYAEAMAKTSQYETEKTKAGQAADAAVRLERQLRDQLESATTQIEKRDKDLASLREQLAESSSLAAKFEAAESSSKAAEAKLQAAEAKQARTEKENKDLKARAYDDLQKVNNLEAELKEKSLELEETTAMCEELISREEKRARV